LRSTIPFCTSIAAHGTDHAAKLDDAAVARALHYPSVMDGDGGFDEVAAERAQSCKRPLLVCAGEAAEADYVSGQDRCEFPVLRHDRALNGSQNSTTTRLGMRM
jgi:hypothetical protein